MFQTVQILGPFNSGTNLMKELLIASGFVESGVNIGRKGQSWVWKHTYQMGPKKLRKMPPNVLNIVMVRDPYFWFQSIKKAPYTIRWGSRGSNGGKLNQLIGLSGSITYCPKIFKRGVEKRDDSDQLTFTFDSLIDLWNHYYRNYTLRMPQNSVVFVSYEDLVRYPLKIVETLSKYLNNFQKTDVQIVSAISESAKKHGLAIDREAALQKLNDPQMRVGCYNEGTLKLIRRKIDHGLMKRFGYNIV